MITYSTVVHDRDHALEIMDSLDTLEQTYTVTKYIKPSLYTGSLQPYWVIKVVNTDEE